LLSAVNPRGRSFAAFAAGLASAMALTLACHALGLASPPRQHGYPLSQYLSGCVGIGFALVYALAAALFGFAGMRRVPIALGMMAPLPIALGIEVIRDPTSHNLLPFEIVLYWLPAFGVAFAGATVGRQLCNAYGPR
jgi:hypothetical protein